MGGKSSGDVYKFIRGGSNLRREYIRDTMIGD